MMQVEVDPQRGGKVTAIRHPSVHRNLLVDEAPESPYPLPDGATFSINGWDEAIPSLEPYGDIPTLGFAWRTAANHTESPSSDRGGPGWGLLTEWQIPGWTLARRIATGEASMKADYVITNTSETPTPLLWAGHALYPVKGLRELVIPNEELIPFPGCDFAEMGQFVTDLGSGRRKGSCEKVGRSWKFFVRNSRPVVLDYDDCQIIVGTEAHWWGIWYNLGQLGPCCVGVEPTNFPTDFVQEVPKLLAPGEALSVSWGLTVVLPD